MTEAEREEILARVAERKQQREQALEQAFENKSRRTEARIMGMSRRALDRILDGKRPPSLEQIRELQERHGIEPSAWGSVYVGGK